MGGIDDLGQGPLAIGRVGIAQAELGVIEDRRQGIVQLVEHAARQDAQAADSLQAQSLAAAVLRRPQTREASAVSINGDPEPPGIPTRWRGTSGANAEGAIQPGACVW